MDNLPDSTEGKKQLERLRYAEKNVAFPHFSCSGLSLSTQEVRLISNAIKTALCLPVFKSPLIELDLSHCNINLERAEYLAKGIAGNQTIEVLNLRGNPLTAAGVELIARAILVSYRWIQDDSVQYDRFGRAFPKTMEIVTQDSPLAITKGLIPTREEDELNDPRAATYRTNILLKYQKGLLDTADFFKHLKENNRMRSASHSRRGLESAGTVTGAAGRTVTFASESQAIPNALAGPSTAGPSQEGKFNPIGAMGNGKPTFSTSFATTESLGLHIPEARQHLLKELYAREPGFKHDFEVFPFMPGFPKVAKSTYPAPPPVYATGERPKKRKKAKPEFYDPWYRGEDEESEEEEEEPIEDFVMYKGDGTALETLTPEDQKDRALSLSPYYVLYKQEEAQLRKREEEMKKRAEKNKELSQARKLGKYHALLTYAPSKADDDKDQTSQGDTTVHHETLLDYFKTLPSKGAEYLPLFESATFHAEESFAPSIGAGALVGSTVSLEDPYLAGDLSALELKPSMYSAMPSNASVVSTGTVQSRRRKTTVRRAFAAATARLHASKSHESDVSYAPPSPDEESDEDLENRIKSERDKYYDDTDITSKKGLIGRRRRGPNLLKESMAMRKKKELLYKQHMAAQAVGGVANSKHHTDVKTGLVQALEVVEGNRFLQDSTRGFLTLWRTKAEPLKKDDELQTYQRLKWGLELGIGSVGRLARISAERDPVDGRSYRLGHEYITERTLTRLQRKHGISRQELVGYKYDLPRGARGPMLFSNAMRYRPGSQLETLNKPLSLTTRRGGILKSDTIGQQMQRYGESVLGPSTGELMKELQKRFAQEKQERRRRAAQESVQARILRRKNLPDGHPLLLADDDAVLTDASSSDAESVTEAGNRQPFSMLAGLHGPPDAIPIPNVGHMGLQNGLAVDPDAVPQDLSIPWIQRRSGVRDLLRPPSVETAPKALEDRMKLLEALDHTPEDRWVERLDESVDGGRRSRDGSMMGSRDIGELDSDESDEERLARRPNRKVRESIRSNDGIPLEAVAQSPNNMDAFVGLSKDEESRGFTIRDDANPDEFFLLPTPSAPSNVAGIPSTSTSNVVSAAISSTAASTNNAINNTPCTVSGSSTLPMISLEAQTKPSATSDSALSSPPETPGKTPAKTSTRRSSRGFSSSRRGSHSGSRSTSRRASVASAGIAGHGTNTYPAHHIAGQPYVRSVSRRGSLSSVGVGSVLSGASIFGAIPSDPPPLLFAGKGILIADIPIAQTGRRDSIAAVPTALTATSGHINTGLGLATNIAPASSPRGETSPATTATTLSKPAASNTIPPGSVPVLSPIRAVSPVHGTQAAGAPSSIGATSRAQSPSQTNTRQSSASSYRRNNCSRRGSIAGNYMKDTGGVVYSLPPSAVTPIDLLPEEEEKQRIRQEQEKAYVAIGGVVVQADLVLAQEIEERRRLRKAQEEEAQAEKDYLQQLNKEAEEAEYQLLRARATKDSNAADAARFHSNQVLGTAPDLEFLLSRYLEAEGKSKDEMSGMKFTGKLHFHPDGTIDFASSGIPPGAFPPNFFNMSAGHIPLPEGDETDTRTPGSSKSLTAPDSASTALGSAPTSHDNKTAQAPTVVKNRRGETKEIVFNSSGLPMISKKAGATRGMKIMAKYWARHINKLISAKKMIFARHQQLLKSDPVLGIDLDYNASFPLAPAPVHSTQTSNADAPMNRSPSPGVLADTQKYSGAVAGTVPAGLGLPSSSPAPVPRPSTSSHNSDGQHHSRVEPRYVTPRYLEDVYSFKTLSPYTATPLISPYFPLMSAPAQPLPPPPRSATASTETVRSSIFDPKKAAPKEYITLPRGGLAARNLPILPDGRIGDAVGVPVPANERTREVLRSKLRVLDLSNTGIAVPMLKGVSAAAKYGQDTLPDASTTKLAGTVSGTNAISGAGAMEEGVMHHQDPRGIMALSAVLSHPSCGITHLDISKNVISSRITEPLLFALDSNHSVMSLQASNTSAGPILATALVGKALGLSRSHTRASLADSRLGLRQVLASELSAASAKFLTDHAPKPKISKQDAAAAAAAAARRRKEREREQARLKSLTNLAGTTADDFKAIFGLTKSKSPTKSAQEGSVFDPLKSPTKANMETAGGKENARDANAKSPVVSSLLSSILKDNDATPGDVGHSDNGSSSTSPLSPSKALVSLSEHAQQDNSSAVIGIAALRHYKATQSEAEYADSLRQALKGTAFENVPSHWLIKYSKPLEEKKENEENNILTLNPEVIKKQVNATYEFFMPSILLTLVLKYPKDTRIISASQLIHQSKLPAPFVFKGKHPALTEPPFLTAKMSAIHQQRALLAAEEARINAIISPKKEITLKSSKKLSSYGFTYNPRPLLKNERGEVIETIEPLDTDLESSSFSVPSARPGSASETSKYRSYDLNTKFSATGVSSTTGSRSPSRPSSRGSSRPSSRTGTRNPAKTARSLREQQDAMEERFFQRIVASMQEVFEAEGVHPSVWTEGVMGMEHLNLSGSNLGFPGAMALGVLFLAASRYYKRFVRLQEEQQEQQEALFVQETAPSTVSFAPNYSATFSAAQATSLALSQHSTWVAPVLQNRLGNRQGLLGGHLRTQQRILQPGGIYLRDKKCFAALRNRLDLTTPQLVELGVELGAELMSEVNDTNIDHTLLDSKQKSQQQHQPFDVTSGTDATTSMSRESSRPPKSRRVSASSAINEVAHSYRLPFPLPAPATSLPLTILNLRHNNLCPLSIRQLCRGLRGANNLRVLDISNNPIGAAGAYAIASLLESGVCELEDLRLSHCLLSDRGRDLRGLHALFDSLTRNNTLACLDLSHNAILLSTMLYNRKKVEQQLVHRLEEILMANTSLAILDLRGNNLSITGSRITAEALKQSPLAIPRGSLIVATITKWLESMMKLKKSRYIRYREEQLRLTQDKEQEHLSQTQAANKAAQQLVVTGSSSPKTFRKVLLPDRPANVIDYLFPEIHATAIAAASAAAGNTTQSRATSGTYPGASIAAAAATISQALLRHAPGALGSSATLPLSTVMPPLNVELPPVSQFQVQSDNTVTLAPIANLRIFHTKSDDRSRAMEFIDSAVGAKAENRRKEGKDGKEDEVEQFSVPYVEPGLASLRASTVPLVSGENGASTNNSSSESPQPSSLTIHTQINTMGYIMPDAAYPRADSALSLTTPGDNNPNKYIPPPVPEPVVATVAAILEATKPAASSASGQDTTDHLAEKTAPKPASELVSLSMAVLAATEPEWAKVDAPLPNMELAKGLDTVVPASIRPALNNDPKSLIRPVHVRKNLRFIAGDATGSLTRMLLQASGGLTQKKKIVAPEVTLTATGSVYDPTSSGPTTPSQVPASPDSADRAVATTGAATPVRLTFESPGGGSAAGSISGSSVGGAISPRSASNGIASGGSALKRSPSNRPPGPLPPRGAKLSLQSTPSGGNSQVKGILSRPFEARKPIPSMSKTVNILPNTLIVSTGPLAESLYLTSANTFLRLYETRELPDPLPEPAAPPEFPLPVAVGQKRLPTLPEHLQALWAERWMDFIAGDFIPDLAAVKNKDKNTYKKKDTQKKTAPVQTPKSARNLPFEFTVPIAFSVQMDKQGKPSPAVPLENVSSSTLVLSTPAVDPAPEESNTPAMNSAGGTSASIANGTPVVAARAAPAGAFINNSLNVSMDGQSDEPGFLQLPDFTALPPPSNAAQSEACVAHTAQEIQPIAIISSSSITADTALQHLHQNPLLNAQNELAGGSGLVIVPGNPYGPIQGMNGMHSHAMHDSYSNVFSHTPPYPLSGSQTPIYAPPPQHRPIPQSGASSPASFAHVDSINLGLVPSNQEGNWWPLEGQDEASLSNTFHISHSSLEPIPFPSNATTPLPTNAPAASNANANANRGARRNSASNASATTADDTAAAAETAFGANQIPSAGPITPSGASYHGAPRRGSFSTYSFGFLPAYPEPHTLPPTLPPAVPIALVSTLSAVSKQTYPSLHQDVLPLLQPMVADAKADAAYKQIFAHSTKGIQRNRSLGIYNSRMAAIRARAARRRWERRIRMEAEAQKARAMQRASHAQFNESLLSRMMQQGMGGGGKKQAKYRKQQEKAQKEAKQKLEKKLQKQLEKSVSQELQHMQSQSQAPSQAQSQVSSPNHSLTASTVFPQGSAFNQASIRQPSTLTPVTPMGTVPNLPFSAPVGTGSLASGSIASVSATGLSMGATAQTFSSVPTTPSHLGSMVPHGFSTTTGGGQMVPFHGDSTGVGHEDGAYLPPVIDLPQHLQVTVAAEHPAPLALPITSLLPGVHLDKNSVGGPLSHLKESGRLGTCAVDEKNSVKVTDTTRVNMKQGDNIFPDTALKVRPDLDITTKRAYTAASSVPVTRQTVTSQLAEEIDGPIFSLVSLRPRVLKLVMGFLGEERKVLVD